MSRIELLDLLHQGLHKLNQPQPAKVEHALINFIELISKWNRAYNLTAIRDLDAMVVRHLLDSLSIASFIKGNIILDVGTGAGLPGIPLALIFPDKQFVLVDSNQKKTRFLVQAVHALHLTNVKIVHQRVEELTHEPFDTVICRAFSTLREFLISSKKFAKPQGRFLAMKGVYPLIELEDLPEGFSIVGAHRLEIPALDAERHLIEVGLT